MAAFDRAMMRSTVTDATTIRPIKTDAEILWSALRADRASRDERTARLRAMALAIGN